MPMNSAARFLFITCQVGAEQAVKAEVALRLARLSFRLFAARLSDLQAAAGHGWPEDFELR